MNNHKSIEGRLEAIEGRLVELCKLLVSGNQIPARDSIATLASKLASGDRNSLLEHNKMRQQARRTQ